MDCPSCESEFESQHGLNIHHSTVHGESLTKVETECDNCGKTIKIHRYRYSKSNNNFCDNKCHSEYKSGTMSGENNPSYNSSEVNCAYCGDELTLPKSRIKKTENNFCDVECKAKWLSEYRNDHRPQEEKIAVNCSNCGKELNRTPQRVAKYERQFCDKKCEAEWRRGRTGKDAPQFKENIIECSWCGREFHRQPGSERKSKRNFCSLDCKNEWLSDYLTGSNHPQYIEGEFHYGEGWNEEKRKNVRERDGFRCVYCGIDNDTHKEMYGSKLHVHHIKPARLVEDESERNAMENLETVCSSCHRKVESIYPLRPS